MNTKLSIFFLSVILFFSCSRQIRQDGITVSGQFLNAADKKICFYELEVDGIKNIDSTILNEKGTFKFTYTPSDAGFYIIKVSSGENILLLMEKDESASISADLKKSPFVYRVSGSPGSLLLKDFYSQTFINLSRADSLVSVLRKLQDTPGFYQQSLAFDPLFNKIVDDQKLFERMFIARNMKSLASLIVLDYKLGMLPVLKEDEDFDLWVKLDSTLTLAYPANKHILFFHQKVAEHSRERSVQKIREEEKRKDDKN